MNVNFRTFTLDEVRMVLNDTGYETPAREFQFAEDNELFKYLGCVNGAARYMIGFEEDVPEEGCYASIVYVTIGADKLQADYGGMPEHQAKTLEELAAYFENRAN